MNHSPRGIFWLASYPKSGNTWARAFLSSLMALTSETDDEQKNLDINELATGAIGSSREWVQDALGFEIGELSHAEIDHLRPAAYQWIADNEELGFHKLHDAYVYLDNGKPLIPSTATRGAVYIVRNPMDVAVSLSNHSGIKIQAAVDQVCDSNMAFCQSSKAQPSQLRQRLMSWGEHVESWLSADIPKFVCRYEDMQLDTKKMFADIANFLEIEATDKKIEAAIQASSFENLKGQEDEQGFAEKIPGVKNFFRKGVVGDWCDQLSEQQIAQIIDANKASMQMMGYLDDAGMTTPAAIGQHRTLLELR